MNLIFFYALIFVVIPLGIYFLFAFIIIFHIKKYGMEKDFNKKTLLVFCFGMAAISFMIVEKFSVIEWDDVNMSQNIEDSNIKLFYIDYDRR